MNQSFLDDMAEHLMIDADKVMPDVAADHQKIADALRAGNLDEALKLAEAYPNTSWWLLSILTNPNNPT